MTSDTSAYEVRNVSLAVRRVLLCLHVILSLTKECFGVVLVWSSSLFSSPRGLRFAFLWFVSVWWLWSVLLILLYYAHFNFII